MPRESSGHWPPRGKSSRAEDRMPTNIIMPALELAQETGKIIHWLKRPGEPVQKGEPVVEIETDKVTVELEAPASGVLRDVSAREGDVVPVGRTIAVVFAAGEASATAAASPVMPAANAATTGAVPAAPVAAGGPAGGVKASPLARKLAEQHGVDLTRLRTASGRIEKADVLAFVESQKSAARDGAGARLTAASPKARRLAVERGVDIGALRGSGPGGAVLALDVPAEVPAMPSAPRVCAPGAAVGTVWRIMAERMTTSWTSAPHFYLVREVNVSRLISWLDRARKQTGAHITYTDLLVKLVAAAMALHPRVNVSWRDGSIVQHPEINIGLAVALDDGLVVPVIHRADTLRLAELAARREDVVGRAQSGKLRPADI